MDKVRYDQLSSEYNALRTKANASDKDEDYLAVAKWLEQHEGELLSYQGEL